MVRKQADGRSNKAGSRSMSDQHSEQLRDYSDYYGLLMRRRRSPAWPAAAGKWTKQKTVGQLTSTPLLSISAASSYSGFIFLQCPHPKRFTSVIRARTVTQIIDQKAIFWYCTFKNEVTIGSETQTDSNCYWIWTTARWFFLRVYFHIWGIIGSLG